MIFKPKKSFVSKVISKAEAKKEKKRSFIIKSNG
jgi:hypothetical protein